MDSVEQALQTQLKNIQTKTGRTFDELTAFIRTSGLTKHGEIRDLLKRELGLGHGDANTLTQFHLKAATAQSAPSSDNVLDEIYAGPKAPLRPIHDQLMAAIAPFGAIEIAPKKGYVSLRRKKQFAMIGPATKGRVEVGLNMKDMPANVRLIEQPAGGMCQYKVYLTEAAEVNPELCAWIKQAYDSAG